MFNPSLVGRDICITTLSSMLLRTPILSAHADTILVQEFCFVALHLFHGNRTSLGRGSRSLALALKLGLDVPSSTKPSKTSSTSEPSLLSSSSLVINISPSHMSSKASLSCLILFWPF